MLCENVEKNILLERMKDDGLLDTSNYKPDNPLHSMSVANKIGLVKDESCGVLNFIEWIFLRPKCYSMLLSDGSEQLRAKGISLRNTNIDHEMYKCSYMHQTECRVDQRLIESINHQLYTIKRNKVALSSMDDKRQWIGINESRAYGHYSL